MERFFQTVDFRSTLRDYDFTRKAVRGIQSVVASSDFADMESEKIFQYLLSQMQVVSFKDYLKRYIYEHAALEEPFRSVSDDAFLRMAADAFNRNRAPHSLSPTSVKRNTAIRRWLEQDSVQRSVVFLLGFGLRMSTEDVSDFLTKAIQEADFDPHDPWEMICRFCFENGLPYARAAALMEEYHNLSVKRAGREPAKPLADHCSEAELKSWLRRIRDSDARVDSARREVFLALYHGCQAVVATLYQNDEVFSDRKHVWTPEDVGPADIERMLCDGIPRTRSGNLQRMSGSMLNRQFRQKRLTRQRLDLLLKGELTVERFDIITLQFLISSQQEDEDPRQRLRRFMDECNAALERCGMRKLYPANPYEAFIMMCLLGDMPLLIYYDVWEMSFEEG